ncbi:DUF4112 domain-containing protein [Marinobacter sp.]|uniref:DUF4112 domain-containing protein n=1 Tax=Marinobacter sp. TaxID=50741 RepID=UPI00384AA2E4
MTEMKKPSQEPQALTPEQKLKHERALARLDRYARTLDSRFRIPFTRIRFGLDPLVGLVPGIGDAIGLGLSFYLISEAVALRAGSGIVGKMLGNVAVDFLVGLVPLLGDAFDLVWRANDRNANLLRQHINQRLQPPEPPRKSWLVRGLWLVLGALLVVLAGVILAALMSG